MSRHGLESKIKQKNERIWKRIKNKKTYVFISVLMLSSLWGCARSPEAVTPEQRLMDKMQEQGMVREVLEETSPRGLNNLPKAVPEFRARLRPQCPEGQ